MSQNTDWEDPDTQPATEVPANERAFWPGGLMRCCTDTLMSTTTPSRVGSTLRCKYAEQDPSHVMIVGEDGHWRWHR